jgi:hypothetical protein
MKKIGLIVGLLLLAITMSSCGYSTSSDAVALEVGKGPFDTKKVKGCKDAATRGYWSNDKYVYFATSEREWDATGQDESDSGPFTSVTKDSVVMEMPITVRFTLKTDCKTLTDFYNKYAKRYDAHFESDGTHYSKGWVTLLRKLVAQPTDQTLDRIIQTYNWRDVWQNPSTKTEIEKQLGDALSSSTSLMIQTAKASYFEGISVLIGSPQPQNNELKQAVALEQTNVAKAQSEEAQANAEAAKARAQKAVSEAEAAKQRAEIDGYPNVDAYLKAKAIQQGLNPYQPTYIVSGTKQ